MPHLHHDLCLIRPTPAGQGSADGSSVPRDNRTGVRGEGSLPLAPRISLYPGALVLFCGPADRELLSVLISDARPSAMAARFLWSRWKAAVPFSSRNRHQIAWAFIHSATALPIAGP